MVFARHWVFFAQDIHNIQKSRTHVYQLGFIWRNRTGGKDHKEGEVPHAQVEAFIHRRNSCSLRQNSDLF